MKTCISHVIFIKIDPTKPHLTQPNLTVEKENTKNRKKSKKNYAFFFLCKFGISMRNCIFDVIFIKIGLYVWNAKCPSCSFVVRKCQKKINISWTVNQIKKVSRVKRMENVFFYLTHPIKISKNATITYATAWNIFLAFAVFFTLIN